MEEQNLTRTEMAKRMSTSRVQLNHLLDPQRRRDARHVGTKTDQWRTIYQIVLTKCDAVKPKEIEATSVEPN